MDFITGRSLSRRTVLRGAGAALALPFLDAMTPAARLSAIGSARAEPPPHRFVAYYTPNGQAMEYWTPKGEGRDFELSEILQPLEAFRDDLIVPTGLHASWDFGHDGAPTHFLTGMTGLGLNEEGRQDNTSLLAETSMDQMLARRVREGDATRVLGAVARWSTKRWHLRGSELCLHSLVLLAESDPAVADGKPPEGRCSSVCSATAEARIGGRESCGSGCKRAYSTPSWTG